MTKHQIHEKRSGVTGSLNKFPEILFCKVNKVDIAYVPSRGITFRLNEMARKKISNLIVDSRKQFTTNDDKIVANCLEEISMRKARFLNSENLIPFSDIVLLLTRKCNLRCRYCYSNGGFSTNEMNIDAAVSAIEFVTDNILNANKKRINVSYHGGGEPTLAWTLLKKIHQEIKQKSTLLGINLRTRLTSNGVWTSSTAKWIAENINSVLISMDGPYDIMYLHRPLYNGSNPTYNILNSIKILRNNGHKIKIRATISNVNVSLLPKLIEYFVSISASSVQLEPLTPVGRATESKINKPDPNEFIVNFEQARNLGASLDCKVTCSYLRPSTYSNVFCSSALGRALILTPEGKVTVCHRVSTFDDPGSEDFMVGEFNSNVKKMEIDYLKLDQLNRRSMVTPSHCLDCIARYNCFGGCHAQNAATSGNKWFPDPYRCEITRKLFSSFLLNATNQTSGSQKEDYYVSQ